MSGSLLATFSNFGMSLLLYLLVKVLNRPLLDVNIGGEPDDVLIFCVVVRGGAGIKTTDGLLIECSSP